MIKRGLVISRGRLKIVDDGFFSSYSQTAVPERLTYHLDERALVASGEWVSAKG